MKLRPAIPPIFACILLAACAAPGVTQSPDASRQPDASAPQTAPLEGSIVFARAGGTYGDETIFIANADGTGERQLSAAGEACCPAVSPDGSLVLAITEDPPASGRVIGVTIAIDGGDVEPLVQPDPTLNLAPQAWSPDGTSIVYEGWDHDDPTRTGVYTATYPDGEDLTRLTTPPEGTHDIPADWSPDGDSIVFYRAAPEPLWDQGGTLWIVGADGSDARQIVTPDFDPSWWARWSPDGSQLLFASGRLESEGAIWIADADGSNLSHLFTDAEGRFPITPTWSPDGSQIMFALDSTNDEFLHLRNEIYVITADGTGLTQVLGGDDAKRRMNWFD